MAEEKKVAAKKEATAKKTTKAAPKAAKKPAKKVEKKVEKVETKKVSNVHEAKAIAYDVRVTPRKVRLVIDLVRNKSVAEALGILANLRKAAATPVAKVIKSAAANATNNFGLDGDKLYVATIFATDGMRIKRYLPRAKGSASGLVKRMSHITVVVKER